MATDENAGEFDPAMAEAARWRQAIREFTQTQEEMEELSAQLREQTRQRQRDRRLQVRKREDYPKITAQAFPDAALLRAGFARLLGEVLESPKEHRGVLVLPASDVFSALNLPEDRHDAMFLDAKKELNLIAGDDYFSKPGGRLLTLKAVREIGFCLLIQSLIKKKGGSTLSCNASPLASFVLRYVGNTQLREGMALIVRVTSMWRRLDEASNLDNAWERTAGEREELSKEIADYIRRTPTFSLSYAETPAPAESPAEEVADDAQDETGDAEEVTDDANESEEDAADLLELEAERVWQELQAIDIDALEFTERDGFYGCDAHDLWRVLGSYGDFDEWLEARLDAEIDERSMCWVYGEQDEESDDRPLRHVLVSPLAAVSVAYAQIIAAGGRDAANGNGSHDQVNMCAQATAVWASLRDRFEPKPGQ